MTAAEEGLLEGIVVSAVAGWYEVATGRGTLLCRPRGRFRGREERWRDRRDVERALAALELDDLDDDADEAARPSGSGQPGGRRRVRVREEHKEDEAPRSFPVLGGPVGEALVPLAGDRVLCRDVGDGEGAIEAVLPRRNQLARPPVANLDQVVVVVAWSEPPFSALFVDRVLVEAARAGAQATVCLNKIDLLGPGERARVREALRPYEAAGYGVVCVSAVTGEGIGALEAALAGRVAVLAGPSGSGKSRLLSALVPERPQPSGELSQRTRRGRHTTRRVSLLPLRQGGWVADTPGFSRLDLAGLPPEDLAACYPEFAAFAEGCRFHGCLHDREPDCAVRAAAEAGRLDPGRYGRYRELLAEVREAWANRY